LVLLGGEEIRLKDVEKVHRIGGHMKIMNHYGPTEATIGCVARFIDFDRFDQYKKHPTIGSPIDNMKAVVLDNRLMLMPVGVAGELCVSGANIARGYLNQPELTTQKFLSVSQMSDMSYVSYIYRTGDLARWLTSGMIEFLGRIDQQVKIRGYRIETGEIQSQLLKHKAIKEVVVVPFAHSSGDKYLCAYIVWNPEKAVYPAALQQKLQEYLADKLPDYMIPSSFVTVDRIPLTPNGKLNRKLLPKPEIKIETRYVAPGDAVEKKLLKIWEDVLSPGGQPSAIGINDNFFHWGGHSLTAIILISRMFKVFQVNVPLAEIFKTPTIRGLSNYIKSKKKIHYSSIDPVEEKDYYILSSAQKRLYILQQMDETSTGYNMPSIMVLKGEIDKSKLQNVFSKLIKRHESLRTSLVMIEGVPVQRIKREVYFGIEYWDLITNANLSITAINHPEQDEIIKNFITPFDLSQAPLLRVGLIKLEHREHLFMVDMHHIVSDGISRRILVKELMALMGGEQLPALRIQYKDFSQWQDSETQKETLIYQEGYWRRQLAGEIPVLDLPFDYLRPLIQRFEGDCVTFEIDQEEASALTSLAQEKNTTLYMMLLAIYYIFLSKLSSQEDILIGTPTAGRRHVDLEPLIGMFVNTLVLRNYPTGEKTYREFLHEIKERALEAFENQDYPYENLVEQLSKTRDTSRNPLFDTMFVIQNMDIPLIEIPGLKLTSYQYQLETSKFDFTLIGVEIEKKLVFNVEYNTNLFKKASIERFITYFKTTVAVVLENPDIKIAEVDILSEEEKRQLLMDFNDTEMDYPNDKTLQQLFAEQMEKFPAHTALVGQIPNQDTLLGQINTLGEAQPSPADYLSITYRELNEKSNQLASLLCEKGVGPDIIVAIMMQRSIEMIIAVFGILKAGGAYLPLEPQYPAERINYMLADSKAKMMVTTGNLFEDRKIGTWENITNLEVVLIDFSTLLPLYPSTLPSSHLHLSSAPVTSLAYIIYTSGSTGRPKGVMIKHDSAVNIIYALFKQYPFFKTDTYLFKTSYVFDVSVSEIFGWFWEGGRLALLEPGGEKDPEMILKVVEHLTVSHINFVPSMFNVWVEYLNRENIGRLSSLKYIFLAGEVLSPALVNKFVSLGSHIKLENIYGPTEATIYASSYSLSQYKGESNVSIGKPLPNVQLYILDKNNHFQPVKVAGELCITGVALARGYLNKQELTAEKFVLAHSSWLNADRKETQRNLAPVDDSKRLPMSYQLSAMSYFYKTGDMACWLSNGTVEFLGRMDNQVKIRGYRVELGEIQDRFLTYPGVKEAVVILRRFLSGDKYLCAYVVLKSIGVELNRLSIKEHLLQTLPDYMIPPYMVQLESIPLTGNGKLNRKLLPEPDLGSGDIGYAAPRDIIEEKLATLWEELLAVNRPGIDDNFFERGGHSLKAIMLTAKIHETMNIKMPLAEIFKTPTIRGLASNIKEHYTSHRLEDRYLAIEPVEEKEYYVLSSAQKRLFILHQLDEAGISYNMPSLLQLEGDVDPQRLEHTFIKLIKRHESFRTSFEVILDQPMQRVHDQVKFSIEQDQSLVNSQSRSEGSSPTKVEKIIQGFIRPFDLSRPPLLRVGFINVEQSKYILMLDLHHIISDAVSQGVLIKDFMALYAGETLPPLTIGYKDYSQWQQSETTKQGSHCQKAYWLREFAKEVPVLNLPTDFQRPVVQVFEGSSLGFEIAKEETEQLKHLAITQGSTLYMVLLALFNVFWAKISGQEEIMVGSPAAGRRHPGLEPIIGIFINTLALRSYPTGEKTVKAFLKEIRDNTLKAQENQDYPFEDLVELLEINRDASRNLLFDVMFVFQNTERPTIEIPGLKLRPYRHNNRISKFDLTFIGVEQGEKLVFIVEYCTKLFKEETILRFIRYLKQLLFSILENPERKLLELSLLPEDEKNQVLHDFNSTGFEYPTDKTIHGLFEERVENWPHHIAVVDGSRQFTYHQLNENANRFAGGLRGKGVQPGTLVAIMLDRSLELILGMLSIWKAGGAYLPIDPDYPAERIQYMLTDSEAEIVINSSLLAEEAQNIFLEGLPVSPVAKKQPVTGNQQPAASLAYVIYTSGSTGRPKGVLVKHQGFVNLIYFHQNTFGEDQHSRISQVANPSFDAMAFEVWPCLSSGAALYIVENETRLNPAQMKHWLIKKGITISFQPTVIAEYLLDELWPEQGVALRSLRTAGDRLTRYPSHEYPFTLYNLYGPTEDTVWTTWATINAPGDPEPGKFPGIGTPVGNHRVYIVDSKLALQPIGIPGELCIGGVGLAEGYLNRPELTAEKFKRAVISHTSLVIDSTSELSTKKQKEQKVPGKNHKNHMQPCNHAAMQPCSHAATPSPHYPITPSPHSPIYLTGDLARWLPDGNIEFIGRIDQQVKIRGFRIEPGEIQEQLLKHQNIKEALVVCREDERAERYLCAYVVPRHREDRRDLEDMELRSYLLESLPEYMVPSYMMILEKMPLNPSGKLDHNALPEPTIRTGENNARPENEIEITLVRLWSEILNLDKGVIGVHDNFFHLGGHSLKATILASKTHQAFNVKIPLAGIFKTPTIRQLSQYIQAEQKEQYVSIEMAEKKEYYPLSSAQKRMYLLQQMDLESTAYHIPAAFTLEGELKKTEFENTFRKLIQRHESLRTSFHMIAEEPVQRIHENFNFEIDYSDLAVDKENHKLQMTNQKETEVYHSSGNRIINHSFIRPFNLSGVSLLRVGLVKMEESKHLFQVDMHHIISDGTSISIFIKEFMSIYGTKELPMPRIQYKDYAEWQKGLRERKKIQEQREYWLKKFTDEIPVLTLPYDFPRPALQRFAGGSVLFEIGEQETNQLKQLALNQDATLYMVLLALFNVFLAKLSGQEDIVVGSPAAGRRHPDLEHVIGIFINTLALRNYPAPGKTIKAFLKEVKDNTLTAQENQDYPFENLVELLEVNRDASRNPLFDVMLVFQNLEQQQLNIPGLQLKQFPWERKKSKFDITCTGEERHNKINFTITYNSDLFLKETIIRFIGYFKQVISAVLAHREKRISGIDILSPEEKRQLLIDFNDTAAEYPVGQTIHQLFALQVNKSPDHVAVAAKLQEKQGNHQSYLTDMTYMSYSELNQTAHRLARQLRAAGVGADTVVGLMTGPSLQMIIGIIAILKAGAAYLPIDPKQPDERVSYMLNDSQAKLLMTQSSLLHRVPPGVAAISIKNSDMDIYDAELRHSGPGTGSTNIVYTIYTSGSTGKPKGVLLEHRNLVNYVSWFTKKARLTGKDRTILTSSFSFDLGYTSVYSSILSGCQLHILPEDIYLSPGDLIDYIVKNRISYIKLTPSLFGTVVESTAFTRENCHSLRLVVLGGEEIKLKDVEKAHTLAKHLEIMNHYGPTEATIGCIAQLIDFHQWEVYRNRPVIGRPIHNMKVFVLDTGLKPTAVGVPGELSLSGTGVVRGYLNRPELTAQKFVEHRSYRSYRSYIYKTGDMACWLSDGTVEFLGRMDSQVKVRGYRVELGEIQDRLLTYPGLKEAVVILRRFPSGDKYLCAYVVLKDMGVELNRLRIKEHLSETLADYMIPPYMVQLESIPLTGNGKLSRKLLPEPELNSGDTGYVAPRDIIEEKLTTLWEELLAVNRPGIDDNFFKRGGHSLKAIMLTAKIHETMDIKIPLAEIFKTPTIRGLASNIKEHYTSHRGEDHYIAIKPVEEKEYYVLSSAQKRLFILHQLDEVGIGYNMLYVLQLEGEVDPQRLEHTFIKLINRHESFRTSFEMIFDRPVQRVHREVKFRIEYDQSLVNSQGRGEVSSPIKVERIIQDLIRPFDLSRPPLLRVGFINVEQSKYILILDLHHIISDAVSRGVLIKDFMALYAGKTLTPLTICYKDYSQWQHSEKEKQGISRQKAYWLREFAKEVPVLNLPTDFPRPVVQGFEGSSLWFEITKEETGQLKHLALTEGATLYMVLLALFNVFLAKISGQEEIVVGSPAAGRRYPGLEPIIGIFINTLALRSYPTGEKTVKAFLKETRDKTLKTQENQDYPFEDLVDLLEINRNASRNPLFDVMFTLQNVDLSELKIPGLKLTPYPYKSNISKFDLSFVGVERGDSLYFSVEYSTKLFKENTIKRFIKSFQKLVTGILENNQVKIRDIEIISGEERRQILNDFNNTRAEFPADRMIQKVIEEQVEKSPHHIALTFKNRSLTYRVLNEKANQLGKVLIEKGTMPGFIAALMVERSMEMIIGLLAVLKIGAAYVPMDPEYPKERIQYMLEDSYSQLLLTRDDWLAKVEFKGAVVKMNNGNITGEALSNPDIAANPHQLAYIIYTSGSTGKPKGVVVEHSSVINLAFSQKKQFDINERDRVLQFSSICFDASVEQIFISLFSGAVLVLIDRNTLLDMSQFEHFLASRCISHLHSIPSFLLHVELKDIFHLKRVISGGDICPAALARKWSSHCDFYNEYGPTETTVTSIQMLAGRVDESLSRLPVGKPIHNTTVYLLDHWLNPVLLGVVGELYIGGEGVARGYLNRPELTAEKFIHLEQVSTGLGRCVSYNPLLKKWNRLYRTGDLAKWLPNGNVEFLGRIDHQVKIRGFRIEPEEIEKLLVKFERIKKAVVLARKDEQGDTYLCAYIVADMANPTRAFDVPGLTDYLLKFLPDYMVPSYFMQVKEIPLTPTGKINRKALPEPALKTGKNYVPPGNAIETILVRLWSEILNLDRGAIGVHDNFFQLGGHSLKAAILISKLHKEFQVKVPLADVFQTPFIKGLAKRIQGMKPGEYTSIRPGEEKEFYPASYNQHRIWLLNQTTVGATTFNMTGVITLDEKSDIHLLKRVLNRIIQRHDSFRTGFKVIDDQLVQVVKKEIEVPFEMKDFSSIERPVKENKIQEIYSGQLAAPFDLKQMPLFRVLLLKLAEEKYKLLFNMHHIISDGWSIERLKQEFNTIYNAYKKGIPCDMKPLGIQYKDYAAWQNQLLANEEKMAEVKEFWKGYLSGTLPVLNLPYDYTDYSDSTASSSYRCVVPESITSLLRKMSADHHASLFMTLLAVFNITLSQVTGQKDIVLAIPAAARQHETLKDVVGLFVNTLILRVKINPEQPFIDFFKHFQENMFKILDNQSIPLELIFRKLNIKYPPISAFFNMINIRSTHQQTLTHFESRHMEKVQDAKFDIVCYVSEYKNGIEINCHYFKNRFQAITIEMLMDLYLKMLDNVCQQPGKKLKEYSFTKKKKKLRHRN
jgi:tyrocidine synthetase-3